MRHPDGTVLLCPDGECGGAACVRCEPLPIRYSQRCRLCNTWRISGSKACPEHRRSRRQRRQALAAFGNVLTTVGSAAPWTDVDDWAKLYRYTAKVRADTFARAERHLDERDEARAEVERLRQRVENLSQQLAAVDAITVEHGRDEMLTRTEWLHAELARRDAAVPECVRRFRSLAEQSTGFPSPMWRCAQDSLEWLATAPLAALAEQAESAPTLAELCDNFGPPAAIVAKDASDAEVLRQTAAWDDAPPDAVDVHALRRARIVDGAKLDALAERWSNGKRRDYGMLCARELRAALEGDK